MHDEDKGLAGNYRGPQSRASTVLALMRRRVSLRCELEVIGAQIADVVPALTQAERGEVIAALSAEDAKADREMAERVQAEEAAAAHARRMTVPLSRAASALVQQEAERLASRGAFLSSEALVTEAIRRAYGNH